MSKNRPMMTPITIDRNGLAGRMAWMIQGILKDHEERDTTFVDSLPRDEIHRRCETFIDNELKPCETVEAKP